MGSVGSIIGSGVLGSGFTPLALPSLWGLWDDQSGVFDASSNDAEGGPVHTWNDRSGNGRHLVQATPANQPIADVTQNGRRGLRFVRASSHWMGRAFGASNGPLFMWSVVRTRDLTNEQQYFSVASTGFTFVSQSRFNVSASQRLTTRFPEASLNAVAIVSNTWYRGSALIRSTTDRAVRLNNANEATTATLGAFGTANQLSVGGLSQDGTTASAFLEGDILALLACTAIPTAQQLADLDAWAASRYAI